MPVVDLSKRSLDLVIAVDITFVDSNGANPVALQVSDRPYYDASGSTLSKFWDVLERIGDISYSLVQGVALAGSSKTGEFDVDIIAIPKVKNLIAGLNCERQRLRIRKGLAGAPLSDFKTVFDGLAEGHQLDGSRLRIRSFDSSKLFDIAYQPRTWEGKGRHVVLTEEASTDYGQVTLPDPDGIAPTTALTIEIAFTPLVDNSSGAAEWIIQQDNGGTINWRLTRHSNGDYQFRLRQDASTVVKVDSVDADANAFGSSVFAAMRWDGTNQTLFINGEKDGEGFFVTTPVHNAGDIRFGGLTSGSNAQTAIDWCRIWVDVARTDAQIAEGASHDPIDPDDNTGLKLWLPFNEGLGIKAYDPDRDNVATLKEGAFWRSSKTGDVGLRGKRMPSCFGEKKRVSPVLVDRISQRYAVHHDDVKSIAPEVGARPLSVENAVTGLVTFNEVASLLEADTAGLDLSFVQPWQSIRVTGTTNNNADFRLAGRPWFIAGVGWKIPLRDAPVQEASVNATITSVSSTNSSAQGIARVDHTSVAGDFDRDDRTFTTTGSDNLSGFKQNREVKVTNGNNDGRTFTLFRDASQDAAGKWVLRFNEPVAAETGASVDLLTDDKRPEAVVELDTGQFELSFEPTKPVTAVVEGDNAGASYSSTLAGIAIKILDQMGGSETQALARDTTSLNDLATTEAVGYYDDGISNPNLKLRDVMDFLFQGLGLFWGIRATDANFEVTNLPATMKSVQGLALDVQNECASIAAERGQKARRHVEVRFARNHLRMREDELDLSIQEDRSEDARELVRQLSEDWESVVFPQDGGDDDLQPEIIHSPLEDRWAALDFARTRYNTLARFSHRYYRIETGLVLQGGSGPWQWKITLTDSEISALSSGVVVYPISVIASPFRTRATLMEILTS